MNILSLFDGISCGQVALERAGIKYKNYFASELDRRAIAVTQKNYPTTIQLGDIRNVNMYGTQIDLIMGGSPCQGFSLAGKGKNFKHPESKLVFDYIRIVREYKPKYFLLENVKMKQECIDRISTLLRVEPIILNSALVSAQQRRRLYWTNIPVIDLPEDKNVYLKDILEDKVAADFYLSCFQARNFKIKKSNKNGNCNVTRVRGNYNYGQLGRVYDTDAKAATCCGGSNNGRDTFILLRHGVLRKLTPLEYERLQTLPDNYTKLESNSNAIRYQLLGNGWTVDIVAHILKGLNRQLKRRMLRR